MEAAERRERKFRIALALYGLLALLVWFTLGPGTIAVLGRRVDIRAVPLFVIAMFVFRLAMARWADKIRQGGDPGRAAAIEETLKRKTGL